MKILLTLLALSVQLSVQEPAHARIELGTYYDHGTIVTTDGNIWELEDNSAFSNSQSVIITFDTNNTQSIYDDMIVNIGKLGE